MYYCKWYERPKDRHSQQWKPCSSTDRNLFINWVSCRRISLFEYLADIAGEKVKRGEEQICNELCTSMHQTQSMIWYVTCGLYTCRYTGVLLMDVYLENDTASSQTSQPRQIPIYRPRSVESHDRKDRPEVNFLILCNDSGVSLNQFIARINSNILVNERACESVQKIVFQTGIC